MRNKILIVLAFIVIASGVASGYYLLNGRKTMLEQLESSNSLSTKEINGLISNMDLEEDTVPSYSSIEHIFPSEFVWNDVVDDLERIEVELEIESFKQFSEGDSGYPIYEKIEGEVSFVSVEIAFIADFELVQAYINAIQDLEDITVIDKIEMDYFAAEDLYSVIMEVVYFINTTIEETETT